MTRKETILKLIVQHFIKTAEPVSSKALADIYGLDLSSATIRNCMNELEKEGYLEKTHTSSGRVPSKSGYEYFLNHLREDNLDQNIKMRLQTVMNDKINSIENIIGKSCEILTDMTNLVAIATKSDSVIEHLVSIQVVPISLNSATAIMVTDKGYVENKTFIFEKSVNIDDLNKTVKLLNDRLKGSAINELVDKVKSIKPILSDYIIEHDVVYQAILETFLQFASERYKLYGKDELINQPEFKDNIEKLKKVINLLDNPNQLLHEIDKINDNNVNGNISVHISDKQDLIDDMAVIKAQVSIDGKNEGSISLLGPSRMDYEKAVSLLDYVVKSINDRFIKLGGNENGREESKGYEGRDERGSKGRSASNKTRKEGGKKGK